MKKILVLIFCLMSVIGFSQNIDKQWNFSSIEKTNGTVVAPAGENDVFTLSEGKFNYNVDAKDSLKASWYLYASKQFIDF